MKATAWLLAMILFVPSALIGQTEGTASAPNAAPDSIGAKKTHSWAIGVRTQTLFNLPGTLIIEKRIFHDHSLGLTLYGSYNRDPYGSYQYRDVSLSATASWIYRRPAGRKYLILSPNLGYGYEQEVITGERERITGEGLERDEENTEAVWGGCGIGIGKNINWHGQHFAIEATIQPVYFRRQAHWSKENWYSAPGDSTYVREYYNYTYSFYGRLTEAVSAALLYQF